MFKSASRMDSSRGEIDIVVSQWTQSRLQHAGAAKLRLGKKFRPALATSFGDSGAHRRSASCAPAEYCKKFCHGLLAQHRDEVPQLVLNVSRHRDRVRDLLPQQFAIAPPQSMACLLDRDYG